MKGVEILKESKETVEIPNCFCGEEPALIDDYDVVGDYRYRHIKIQCPYCQAHTDAYGWNTFNPYHKAVEKAIEDWIKIIRRGAKK